jgi:hypothetical protein
VDAPAAPDTSMPEPDAGGGTDTVPNLPVDAQPDLGPQPSDERCSQCKAEQVANALCDTVIGCETIEGADRALCEALHTCMITSHCAANDPLDCFCGTALGTACLIGANGVCRAQTLAATKTEDLTAAGTRFYDPSFPAGRATTEVACRRDFCGPNAEPPHKNACTF